MMIPGTSFAGVEGEAVHDKRFEVVMLRWTIYILICMYMYFDTHLASLKCTKKAPAKFLLDTCTCTYQPRMGRLKGPGEGGGHLSHP